MSLGTVAIREGLPCGGIKDGNGKPVTNGHARRGLDFLEMKLVKTVTKGKAKFKSSRLVMVTGLSRVNNGVTYRLVQIPYTKEERISARRKYTKVRPVHGEYLWADRSRLKPEDPSGGRVDQVVESGNGFHFAWVREDKLERVDE